MAKTAFSTSDPDTKKAWDEKLFRDTRKQSYFSRFMGENSESLCQVKEELSYGKGDNITFTLRRRLEGEGVNSGQSLEGKEESLVRNTFSVSLEEYAHAVRDAGPMDRQRAVFSIDQESIDAIRVWGAEKIDQLCFDELQNAPSKTFFGGTATTFANITASDKIDAKSIARIRAWAKTGGNRAQSTTGQTPLRPINIKGKKYYVLLVHPDVLTDLKADSTFENARREALARSDENPIFSDSSAIWDGVVIHEHENITIGTDAGASSNIPYSDAIFMGAQALTWAWGKRPEVVARDFDYGREHGYAWCMLANPKKPVFDSKDYGSIRFQTARTQISDV